MKIIIKFLTGPEKGTSQEISSDTGEIFIGRPAMKRDNHIVIDPRYRIVGREQASIRLVDGEYVLFDDESANGTFLNGTRIKDARLTKGDVIGFGPGGPQIEITYLPVMASLKFLTGPWEGDKKILSEESITVGRGDGNTIVLGDYMVSAVHARIEFEDGAYWIIDEHSKNGTYVDDRRVDRAVLKHGNKIRFGVEGPEARFESQERVLKPPSPKKRSKTQEFQDAVNDALRKALRKWKVIALVVSAVLLVVIGIVVIYQIRVYNELSKVNEKIKQKERDLEESISKKGDISAQQLKAMIEENAKETEPLREEEIKLEPKPIIKPQTTIIHREINRIIQEFDGPKAAAVPRQVIDDVIKEIGNYKREINYINSNKNKYWDDIVEAFGERGLDEKLAYIAWVESGFDPEKTNLKSGAAGMWQLMPETAQDCGLKVVPGKKEEDERYHVKRSTECASQHIEFLIKNHFPGPGTFLLVVASYDWGQGRVIKKAVDQITKKILSQLSQDSIVLVPSDIFWSIIARCPPETRQYIPRFLAAVIIGTNPSILDKIKKAGE